MPVYNDAELLDKSIQSVLNQSLKDIELICINDGSTDNTLNILETYSNHYEFIKVLNQENQGSGKARNNGMCEAKGEYIAFLDADDFFINNKSLEKLYDIGHANNANMVSGNIKLVDGNGIYSPFTNLDYYEEENKILPEEYGIPWAFYKSIYKKDFLLNNKIYFPDLIRGQDPVFLAEVLSKVDIIYTANIDFYAYYYIDGANQCNTFRKRFDHIQHFKYVFEYFKDSKFDKLRNDFKNKLFIFIDMMGIDGAEDTLFSIREIFREDIILVNECEEYYFKKFLNQKEMLNKLDLDKPKISVIVPVYNAEPFLHESLSSILNQTFKNIEVICVNDGSTDNSLNILYDFAEKDSRIKVITKENGGCGSARNKSLDNATGDYIYFFDPDDYVLPNAFEELYYNAVRNKSDLVMFKIARFRDGEPIDYSIPGFEFEKIFKDVDFNNFTFNYKDIKRYVLNASFAPWTKLYKKSFLDSYPDFRFDLNVAFDDVPFHVKSLLRASKISFIPEFFYHYRLSNPHSVNNTKSNQIDIFKICDLVETFLKESNHMEEFKDEFLEFKIQQISNYIISCNYEEYYILAKQEFKKIDLSNSNIPRPLIENYHSVINSDSYDEYRTEKGYSPINKNIADIVDSPKISVIVPVYNTEKFISRCLDSLINQSLKNIEIICVDDGSTDNSLEILKKYEQKDSRIKVFSKENQGAGSARNLGLENAKGEFINFIDSDDWLDLNTFKELYEKSKENNLDILMYQLININTDTGETYETDYYNLSCIPPEFDNKVFNYKDLSDKIFDIAVSPCNKLLKHEFLKKMDFKFFEGVMFEDNPFFFKIILEANRVSLIRKHFYYRRRRKGSVMDIKGEKLKDIFSMTDELVKVFIEKDLYEEYKARLTNFKFYNIKTWYLEINPKFRESYFIEMKKHFDEIRSNEFLVKLYNSGLYSDTKKWFDSALIASNHKEFDFLINNELKDIIVNPDEYKSYNVLKRELNSKTESINKLNLELISKNKELNSLKSKQSEIIKITQNLNINNNHKNEEIDFLKKQNTYLKKQIINFEQSKLKNRLRIIK